MAFSDKILLLRKEREWSQERLSEELGVSRQAVSKWESGAAMPDLAKLKEISELFRLTLDELVNDEELPLRSPAAKEEGGQAVAQKESPPVQSKRVPAKVLLLAGVLALALLAIGVAVFWPAPKPDYSQPEAIAGYLIETVNLKQPYSQIYLNDLHPEQIRSQMENDGIQVTASNETIEQARRLFVQNYFLSFEEYGLGYDVGEDALYFNGKAVSYFEDYSVESTLTLVAWVGEVEEMAVVVVERNHRGNIISVEDVLAFE